MASKALLFMSGIFLLLLAIQLQVDALRVLPQQLQEAMSTLQGADENDGKYTKPEHEFSLMSKRVAQKDADGDWQQAAAALGHLLSNAAKSQKGCGGTTPATLGTAVHTTVTANTHTTTKQT